MPENHGDTHDPADAEDSREDYTAPTLTHLGSFHELTQNGIGPNPDAEGTS
jgi:hypothetical protein